jgi:hypothetical protein
VEEVSVDDIGEIQHVDSSRKLVQRTASSQVIKAPVGEIQSATHLFAGMPGHREYWFNTVIDGRAVCFPTQDAYYYWLTQRRNDALDQELEQSGGFKSGQTGRTSRRSGSSS